MSKQKYKIGDVVMFIFSYGGSREKLCVGVLIDDARFENYGCYKVKSEDISGPFADWNVWEDEVLARDGLGKLLGLATEEEEAQYYLRVLRES